MLLIVAIGLIDSVVISKEIVLSALVVASLSRSRLTRSTYFVRLLYYSDLTLDSTSPSPYLGQRAIGH